MSERGELSPSSERKEQFKKKLWEKVSAAERGKRLWGAQGSPRTGPENPSAYDHDMISINPDHVAEYGPAIDIWERIEAEIATKQELRDFSVKLNQDARQFPSEVQRSLWGFQAMLGNKAGYLNKQALQEYMKKHFPQKQ